MGAAQNSILLVEDDVELATWLGNELAARGFEVAHAGNGRAAIEMQAQQQFDVAIVDLRMPGIDGIETLGALKRQDPEVEVIVTTGHGTIPDAVDSMKCGAYDFVQKPYTIRQLMPVLEGALDRRQIRRGTITWLETTPALLGAQRAAELLADVSAAICEMLRAQAVGFVMMQPARFASIPIDGPDHPSDLLLQQLSARLAIGESGTLIAAANGDGILWGPFRSALVASFDAGTVPIGRMVVLRRREQPAFTADEFPEAILLAGHVARALEGGARPADLKREQLADELLIPGGGKRATFV